MADNIAVNMDMIKIYVTKDEDLAGKMAKYVSPTLTTNDLLNSLAKKFYYNIAKTRLYIVKDSETHIPLKDKQATLASQNIKDETMINVCQQSDMEIESSANKAESADKYKKLDKMHEDMVSGINESNLNYNWSNVRKNSWEGSNIIHYFAIIFPFFF